jgi:hypothetical protein
MLSSQPLSRSSHRVLGHYSRSAMSDDLSGVFGALLCRGCFFSHCISLVFRDDSVPVAMKPGESMAL